VIQSLPKEIKWTSKYYSENIVSQIASLRDVGSHRKKIAHVDNAGLLGAKCITESMDHNSLKRVPDPPYSPDLAPSDFYRFGCVKHQLKGHEFTERAEFVSAI
jgi:hypothetical protein